MADSARSGRHDSRCAGMLKRLLTAILLLFATTAEAAPNDIAVVYLGADDCRFCQHWEARARGELLASLEGRGVKYYEVKGETLHQPIVERHFPAELKWLARTIGPSRGVPRFLLLVDREVVKSVYGTNDYERVFLPALRKALANRAGASTTRVYMLNNPVL